jgi:hypothetical protein
MMNPLAFGSAPAIAATVPRIAPRKVHREGLRGHGRLRA